MTKIARRLTRNGRMAVEDFIFRCRSGERLDPPGHVLADERYSEPLSIELLVSTEHFPDRFAMGQHLVNVFGSHNVQPLLGDGGFWAWLALLWFDQLCPRDRAGAWSPSKSYNYILSENYNHRPRHAVRTSWMLVNDYGEAARFLLGNEPHKRGDLVEQLLGRQYYISCRGVIHAASRLYLDPDRGTYKRGSATRTRPGNIRRFISYLQQIELTYDLYSIHEERLLNMFPKEFDKFRSSTP